MIDVKKEGVVLYKTSNGFEAAGVLNPAVIKVGKHIHMFYRAVAKGNYSGIGYCRFSDPLTVEERNDTPLIFAQFDYESHGVEDPRIVNIDGLYYLTYTSYDGVNALGSLATSKDLIHFEKLGIIVPKTSFDVFSRLAGSKEPLHEKYARYNQYGHIRKQQYKEIYMWDKNVIFFPRRINGQLYFFHRIKPDVQIVAINELQDLTDEFWQNYFVHFHEHIVLTPRCDHEISYIGGGCPPIETKHGWLIIYHGVHDTLKGYVYVACAALLDLDDPRQEIGRLPGPLFVPEEEWELTGYVNNVCFPTGAVVEGDRLYVYYGAADEQIACASMSVSALLKELLNNKKTCL